MSEVRKRTKAHPVRFSPEEWETVSAAAEAAGMTAGRYMRETLLGKQPRQQRRRQQSDEAIRQLAAIGNNLNQLSRAANASGRMPEAERLAEALAEVLAAVRGLG